MAKRCIVSYTYRGVRHSAGNYPSKKVGKAVFELLAHHGSFSFDTLEIYEEGPNPKFYEGLREHPQLGRIPFA